MSEQTNTGTPETDPVPPSNPEADTPPEGDPKRRAIGIAIGA